jgi:hypothetical protein
MRLPRAVEPVVTLRLLVEIVAGPELAALHLFGGTARQKHGETGRLRSCSHGGHCRQGDETKDPFVVNHMQNPPLDWQCDYDDALTELFLNHLANQQL